MIIVDRLSGSLGQSVKTGIFSIFEYVRKGDGEMLERGVSIVLFHFIIMDE